MTHTAETWNAAYPVGIPVRYWPVLPPGDIPAIHTSTRSSAWTLGDGSPVVLIAGRAGSVHLAHLQVLGPTRFIDGEIPRARKDQQMNLVNLTPYAVVVRMPDDTDRVLAPAHASPRIIAKPEPAHALLAADIGDVPLVALNGPGEVVGLPDAAPGVGYVVDARVLAHPALRHRTDVFAPGTGPGHEAVRDEDGYIVAVRCLVGPAAQVEAEPIEQIADDRRGLCAELREVLAYAEVFGFDEDSHDVIRRAKLYLDAVSRRIEERERGAMVAPTQAR